MSTYRPAAIALFAVFCIGITWLSFSVDVPVRDAIVASQKKGWKKSAARQFHSAVRVYGDWPWLMAAGGAGLVAAWRLKNREWTRILVAAMLASTLAGILANASRLTTGRTRPNAEAAQGFHGPWKDGKTTIGDPAYNSFPSGHTATAFGFAGVLLFARPLFGLPALAVAILIAWSSIVIGAHHPSDITVSIILSLAVAWVTWRIAELRRSRPE